LRERGEGCSRPGGGEKGWGVNLWKESCCQPQVANSGGGGPSSPTSKGGKKRGGKEGGENKVTEQFFEEKKGVRSGAAATKSKEDVYLNKIYNRSTGKGNGTGSSKKEVRKPNWQRHVQGRTIWRPPRKNTKNEIKSSKVGVFLHCLGGKTPRAELQSFLEGGEDRSEKEQSGSRKIGESSGRVKPTKCATGKIAREGKDWDLGAWGQHSRGLTV